MEIVIVGGGPVGLVAAAHARARGLTPVVLEAGDAVGTHVRRWAHVRLFSPWRYLLDETAVARLPASWRRPDPDSIPTGHELVERFVEPLGASLVRHVRTRTRVTGIARRGLDVMKTEGRDAAPFEVRFTGADGAPGAVYAEAVIDASGTYGRPGPLGANGLAAAGEEDASVRSRLHFGVPDLAAAGGDAFGAGRIAVVGSGDTAFNALLALTSPGEKPRRDGRGGSTHLVTWILRGQLGTKLRGGGEGDALPERGRLETAVREAAARGRFAVIDGFRIASAAGGDEGVTLGDGQGRYAGPFDRIVVATGYRPDLTITRELRLDLDPAVEAPRALAPLIDPNVHSCGTVRPHGYVELGHPEPRFFTVGMKSYGRAPTFLLATGYEQVRSVTAYLAGDLEAARAVELALPETGVCGTDSAPSC